MPLIYITIATLGLYGLIQLPEWLRNVVLVIAGFFFLCCFAGFIHAIVRNVASRSFFGRGSQNGHEQSRNTEGSNNASTIGSQPPPPKPSRSVIHHEAEAAKLIEDDFLN